MADLALNIRIKAFNESAAGLRAFRKDLTGLTKEAKRFGILSTTSFRATRREVEGLSRATKGLKLGKGGGPGGVTVIGQMGREAKASGIDIRRSAQGMADLGRAAEGLMRGPVQASLKYETSLSNIRTLTDEAHFSTAQLEDITKKASLQFGGTAADQAGALYDIISAGATDATQAQQTLDAANKLSIGGLTDVGTATKALSATVANFTAEGVTAADASDALFVAVQKGRTTVGETARAFPKVASAAGAMNLKLGEAAAIYSTITLTAKSSADASTQAAAFLGATVKPTKAATDALKRLNRERGREDRRADKKAGRKLGTTKRAALRIDSKALKEMGSLDFAAQFKGLDETDLAKLFGGERARKGVQGLIANLDKLDEARKAQAKRTGETEKAEKTISKTRAHRLKLLKSKMDDAKLTIGEAITPLADTLIPVVTSLAFTAGRLAEDHPGIVKGAAALGVAAVGFGKIGEGVVGVTRTVDAFRGLGPVMGKAAGKVGGLIGKLGPGKLGLLGAIGGLTFAIGTFIDRQLGLSDKLSDAAARIVGIKTDSAARRNAGELGSELAAGGKKVVRDAAGKEITDPAELRRARGRRQLELYIAGQDMASAETTLLSEGFAPKGAAQSGQGRSAIDVKVSVEDGRVKVNSVTSSNHEGEVNATTGDGVGLN